MNPKYYRPTRPPHYGNEKKSELSYRTAVKYVLIIFFLLGLISIAVEKAFPQERIAPKKFLGFRAHEYPTVAKTRIENLRVVTSGRTPTTNLAFVTVEGYQSPDKGTIDVLTLFFSDTVIPELVAVGYAGPSIDLETAIATLETEERRLSGCRRIVDARDGLPKLEVMYKNGETFTVGIATVGDRFMIFRVMVWGSR